MFSKSYFLSLFASLITLNSSSLWASLENELSGDFVKSSSTSCPDSPIDLTKPPADWFWQEDLYGFPALYLGDLFKIMEEGQFVQEGDRKPDVNFKVVETSRALLSYWMSGIKDDKGRELLQSSSVLRNINNNIELPLLLTEVLATQENQLNQEGDSNQENKLSTVRLTYLFLPNLIDLVGPVDGINIILERQLFEGEHSSDLPKVRIEDKASYLQQYNVFPFLVLDEAKYKYMNEQKKGSALFYPEDLNIGVENGEAWALYFSLCLQKNHAENTQSFNLDVAEGVAQGFEELAKVPGVPYLLRVEICIEAMKSRFKVSQLLKQPDVELLENIERVLVNRVLNVKYRLDLRVWLLQQYVDMKSDKKALTLANSLLEEYLPIEMFNAVQYTRGKIIAAMSSPTKTASGSSL